MQSGRYTAHSLVEKYVSRIQEIDKAGPALNSIIELNPDAESIAANLDRERKDKGARGPLHGIPILIKDNIDTADRMMTTAGSLALVGSKPSQDAFVVKRLREAGAVILGKTNLSEWANFRSNHSSSGWSGRGGQTRNPVCGG
jgi:amidase